MKKWKRITAWIMVVLMVLQICPPAEAAAEEAAPEAAEQQDQQDNTQPHVILGFDADDGINPLFSYEVKWGTPLEELPLPSELTGRTDQGEIAVPVTWKCMDDGFGGSVYDAQPENDSAVYTFEPVLEAGWQYQGILPYVTVSFTGGSDVNPGVRGTEQYEAKLNETYYSTLVEAFDAAEQITDGSEIVIEVLRDISLESYISFYIDNRGDPITYNIRLKSTEGSRFQITAAKTMQGILQFYVNAGAVIHAKIENLVLDGGAVWNENNPLESTGIKNTGPILNVGYGSEVVLDNVVIQNNVNTKNLGTLDAGGIQVATISGLTLCGDTQIRHNYSPSVGGINYSNGSYASTTSYSGLYVDGNIRVTDNYSEDGPANLALNGRDQASYVQIRNSFSGNIGICWTGAPSASAGSAKILAKREDNAPLTDEVIQGFSLDNPAFLTQDGRKMVLALNGQGNLVLKQQIQGTISMEPGPFAYGEDWSAPVKTVEPSMNYYTKIYYAGRNATIYEQSTVKPVNAGEYKAMLQFTTDAFSWEEESIVEIDFEILPRTAELVWGNAESRVYDGRPSAVTADVASDSLLGSDRCGVSVSGGTETAAGTHTARAVSLDNSNYKLPDQTEITYTIQKAPAVFTISDQDQVYTGTAKTVRAEGTAEDQTLTLNTGSDFEVVYEKDNQRTASPVEAGTYKVIIKLLNQNFRFDTDITGEIREKEAGMFTIVYADVPENAAECAQPEQNGWYSDHIEVTAQEGWSVSKTIGGVFGETVRFGPDECEQGSSREITIYMKNTETGSISPYIIVYQMDSVAPEIMSVNYRETNTGFLARIVNTLSGGLFFHRAIEVTVQVEDSSSGPDYISWKLSKGEQSSRASAESGTAVFELPLGTEDTLEITAVDKAGNSSLPERTGSILLEETRPVISWTGNMAMAEPENWLQGERIRIQAADPAGHEQSASGLARVTVDTKRFNGTDYIRDEELSRSYTPGSEQAYNSYDETIEFLKSGKYLITVQAKDRAGNVTEESRYINIDTDVPEIIPVLYRSGSILDATSYYNKREIEFNVKLPAGQKEDPAVQSPLEIRCRIRTESGDTLLTPENGRITVIISGDSVQLELLTVDQAGNVLRTPAVYNLVYDDTAPAIQAVAPGNGSEGNSVFPAVSIRYSEPVQKGDGYFSLYRSATGERICRLHSSNNLVYVSGSEVNIRLSGLLDEHADYYVEVDEGFVTDRAGTAGKPFGGRSEWHFKTTGQSVASDEDIVIFGYQAQLTLKEDQESESIQECSAMADQEQPGAYVLNVITSYDNKAYVRLCPDFSSLPQQMRAECSDTAVKIQTNDTDKCLEITLDLNGRTEETVVFDLTFTLGSANTNKLKIIVLNSAYSGRVVDETGISADADEAAILNAIDLSEEQKLDQDPNISVDVKALLKIREVEKEDEKIPESQEFNKLVKSQYFDKLDLDISLEKQVTRTIGEEEQPTQTSQISNTQNPIRIGFLIPEEFRNAEDILVIRSHNGELSQLPVTLNEDGTKGEFLTDCFSGYALVAKKTPVTGVIIGNAKELLAKITAGPETKTLYAAGKKELRPYVENTDFKIKMELPERLVPVTKFSKNGGKDGRTEAIITYRSNRPDVAKVNKSGKVSAVKPGTAVITVTIETKDKSVRTIPVTVTVKQPSVRLAAGAASMKQGKNYRYTILAEGYKTESLTWKTVKKQVAVTGRNTGKLTAVIKAVTPGKDKLEIRAGDIPVFTCAIVVKKKISGELEEVIPEEKEILYTVKKGDYLIKLAKKYQTTPGEIAERNGLQNLNLIYPGDKLYITDNRK
ncbi:LysM peptidoglycan-binding domain-containing protein [Anaerolentibacter hominis]|uniref:LysM peptidoglycan-binding domain-containing protein n=1 Tax=Anaerolentibacter hominis TaxID=3079009 RepID=UPI0031B84CD0